MARRTIVIVGAFTIAVAVLVAVQAGVASGVFGVLRDLALRVQSMAHGLTG
jgi:hypothetical protein